MVSLSLQRNAGLRREAEQLNCWCIYRLCSLCFVTNTQQVKRKHEPYTLLQRRASAEEHAHKIPSPWLTQQFGAIALAKKPNQLCRPKLQ